MFLSTSWVKKPQNLTEVTPRHLIPSAELNLNLLHIVTVLVQHPQMQEPGTNSDASQGLCTAHFWCIKPTEIRMLLCATITSQIAVLCTMGAEDTILNTSPCRKRYIENLTWSLTHLWTPCWSTPPPSPLLLTPVLKTVGLKKRKQVNFMSTQISTGLVKDTLKHVSAAQLFLSTTVADDLSLSRKDQINQVVFSHMIFIFFYLCPTFASLLLLHIKQD